jgi:hypothetical protein
MVQISTPPLRAGAFIKYAKSSGYMRVIFTPDDGIKFFSRGFYAFLFPQPLAYFLHRVNKWIKGRLNQPVPAQYKDGSMLSFDPDKIGLPCVGLPMAVRLANWRKPTLREWMRRYG